MDRLAKNVHGVLSYPIPKTRIEHFIMTTKPYDDSNWREEYKNYTSNSKHLELLENGPKSLSQSWILGALYNKWKKMKGYKDPEPPDCSSSLKEWEQSIKKISK
jgi:hypothetical protein